MSELCRRCGLCCSGVLHGFTWVERQEADRVRALGLRLQEREDRYAFVQPCAALMDPLCSVYADRPAHCCRYRCRLLRRVEAGEEALSTAQRTVRQVRELVRELRTELQLPASAPLWPGVTTWLASLEAADDPVAARRDAAGLLRRVTELELRCRRQFLRADEELPRDVSG